MILPYIDLIIDHSTDKNTPRISLPLQFVKNKNYTLETLLESMKTLHTLSNSKAQVDKIMNQTDR